MKKLKIRRETIRVLRSIHRSDLGMAAGGSDSDTSVGSGYTICLTRIQTLCTTVVSDRCTTP